MFERERVVPRILLFALVLCGVCGPVSAQEWARKMFNETNHDFGTVARASQTDFVF